jgi:hypothetical protein
MTATEIAAAALLAIGVGFAAYAIVSEWRLDRAEREYLEHLERLDEERWRVMQR